MLAIVGLAAMADLRSYTLLVIAVAVASLHELVGLVERKGESIVVPVAYVGTVCYLVLAASGRLANEEGTLLALATLAAFAWAMFGDRSGYQARVGATLLAVLYLGKLLSYIIAIRRLPEGELLSVLMVVVIAFTDIFAMVVGRRWGQHPLTSISPGKTIEGAVGGLVFAVGGALVFVHFMHWAWPLWQTLLITIGTSTAAQIGDIVESALKRDARVKNAGTAFLSHGGVLDRFDSYLFGGIAFYAGLYVCGRLAVIGA